MKARDDLSRYTRLSFLRSKDEAEQDFTKYIAEVSPRKVEMFRSDGRSEFSEDVFTALHDREKNKQEKTTADSPQFSGVTVRE